LDAVQTPPKAAPVIEFHHVNLPSHVTPSMGRFYQDVLGVPPDEKMAAQVIGDMRENPLVFLEAGKIGLHLSTLDFQVPHRYNQVINPVGLGGHIAFRTDDIAGLLERLKQNNVPHSDYGVWSIGGWHQVFLLDPAGNVVEVHQANQ
jgi:glyoxylase I family protein